jgi:hypothetical protein
MVATLFPLNKSLPAMVHAASQLSILPDNTSSLFHGNHRNRRTNFSSPQPRLAIDVGGKAVYSLSL